MMPPFTIAIARRCCGPACLHITGYGRSNTAVFVALSSWTRNNHNSTLLQKPNISPSPYLQRFGASFHSTSRRSRRFPSNDRKGRIHALGKRKDVPGILELCEKEMKEFNLVEYATAMSQLARNRPPRNKYYLLDGLVDHMADFIDKEPLHTRYYSNIVHSITKLDLQTASANRIIDQLGDVSFVQGFFQCCNSQDMANVVWSFAKRKNASIFRIVMANATESHIAALFQAKTQDVSNAAWACGTIGQDRTDLFSLIDDCADWLFANGDHQGITNTAWASATLGHQAPNLFASIEDCSKWLVANGTPQNIANTAWACATLGHRAPNLFGSIEDRSKWLVESGNSQHIANTAWACAKLGHNAPNLLGSIEDRSKWLVESGTPQAIANTAWACATLGHKAPNLFGSIEDRGQWLIENGNSQAIANTAWAFATLGHKAPNLFGSIEDRGQWLVENGNSQDIANTAWAYATLTWA